jgi:tetratricopeptide (TPR) repeat protein
MSRAVFCGPATHLAWLHSDVRIRPILLKALADALMAAYGVSHSVSTLKEAITIYEETLESLPPEHASYVLSQSDLGNALWHFCYMHCPDPEQSIRCVDLLRAVLDQRPVGHPLRDQSIHDLARALYSVSFARGLGGLHTLTESISLFREVLHLRPRGHSDHEKTLGNLGLALGQSFEYHGNLELLKEAVEIQREMLRLLSPGRAERDKALTNLAGTIFTYYTQHGDLSLLAEAINMQREALQLRPHGHPLRDSALNNLAGSLMTSFAHEGGFDTITEAVVMQRECLQLCPKGHPLRDTSLDNLANTLEMRLLHEGHTNSWSEIISLRYEVLGLLPEAHPKRASMMGSLAQSLFSSFRTLGDTGMLNESIALLHKVLDLQPPGNPPRVTTLNNLGEALQVRHRIDGNVADVSKAIILHREALELCPIGHTQRLESLHLLADAHCTPGHESWPEALALYREATQIAHQGYLHLARLLSGMTGCFLDPASPFFDLSEGITRLYKAYSDVGPHVTGRLGLAVSDLRRAEAAYGIHSRNANPTLLTECGSRLLDVYAQVINLLPRAANFGLGHSTRLQAVAGSDEIARNAAARAVMMNHLPEAVEMLEEGRGVFWSQTLHLRTTIFDGVPDSDRKELQRLLHRLAHNTHTLGNANEPAAQHDRDLEMRWRVNNEAQALITKIREYPDLQRFLLPPAFDSLFNSLPDGFVVILNASKLGNHALLLCRATMLAKSLTLKAPSAGFDSAALRAQLPRDLSSTPHKHNGLDDETRSMRLDNGRGGYLVNVLSLLWTSVVRPVVNSLALQVRITSRPCDDADISLVESSWSRPTAALVVCDWRAGILARPRRRQLWRRQPRFRCRLPGVVIYSDARLTHQGSNGLEPGRTFPDHRTARVRDGLRQRLGTASSARARGSPHRARGFRRGPCAGPQRALGSHLAV